MTVFLFVLGHSGERTFAIGGRETLSVRSKGGPSADNREYEGDPLSALQAEGAARKGDLQLEPWRAIPCPLGLWGETSEYGQPGVRGRSPVRC